jgi:A/G-specific adenine glycosylase
MLEHCERICEEHGLAGSKSVFKHTVRTYFQAHGRVLPWRQTDDPYQILVSEIMLQQTQVERVASKYRDFVRKFPDFTALNRASLQSVLAAWQGLGYNRRARYLKLLAKQVLEVWEGIVPDDPEQLRSLPGIGAATAGAIAAFAFNKPVVFLETNIRTVFLHFFFKNRNMVHDKDLIPYVAGTLDRRQPRIWYWALMDLGVMIKQSVVNPSRKSAHYARQSQFQGSDRYVRGQIIRILTKQASASISSLVRATGVGKQRMQGILSQLVKERLVEYDGRSYAIARNP